MLPILAFPYIHIPLILAFFKALVFICLCFERKLLSAFNEDSVQVFQQSYFWFAVTQENATGRLF